MNCWCLSSCSNRRSINYWCGKRFIGKSLSRVCSNKGCRCIRNGNSSVCCWVGYRKSCLKFIGSCTFKNNVSIKIQTSKCWSSRRCNILTNSNSWRCIFARVIGKRYASTSNKALNKRADCVGRKVYSVINPSSTIPAQKVAVSGTSDSYVTKVIEDRCSKVCGD